MCLHCSGVNIPAFPRTAEQGIAKLNLGHLPWGAASLVYIFGHSLKLRIGRHEQSRKRLPRDVGSESGERDDSTAPHQNLRSGAWFGELVPGAMSPNPAPRHESAGQAPALMLPRACGVPLPFAQKPPGRPRGRRKREIHSAPCLFLGLPVEVGWPPVELEHGGRRQHLRFRRRAGRSLCHSCSLPHVSSLRYYGWYECALRILMSDLPRRKPLDDRVYHCDYCVSRFVPAAA